MPQVERTPELLAAAEVTHDAHHTLIEAHQVLTSLEERLLGGSLVAGSVKDAEIEDVPEGFLPNLEREARRVNQSASALLRRLASFRERLGVDHMDGFQEVPGPRSTRVDRDAGLQEAEIERARRRR